MNEKIMLCEYNYYCDNCHCDHIQPHEHNESCDRGDNYCYIIESSVKCLDLKNYENK